MDKFKLIDLLISELGISRKEVIEYWSKQESQSLASKRKKAEAEKAQRKATQPRVSRPEQIIEIPDDDAIYLRIKEFFEDLALTEVKITPQSKIIDDLGIDSLNRIEMVMKCEKEFGINIPDDAVEQFIFVQDVCKYISEKVHDKHSK